MHKKLLFLALFLLPYVAVASTLPHLYDCSEFDYMQGGASCTSGVLTLVGGSSAGISGLSSPADPNVLNGGSDIYVTLTATGSGSGKVFSQSYPGQVQGTMVTFTTGTQTIQVPQPSTGDTNSGIVIYANSSFSGTVSDICIGTTPTPDCSGGGGGGGDTTDNSATSTIEQTQQNFTAGLFLFVATMFITLWIFKKR